MATAHNLRMVSGLAPAAAASGARSRHLARAAWSAFAASVSLAAFGLALELSAGTVSPRELLLYDVTWLALLLAWAGVGALVAARQPGNAIGWILCGLALFVGVAAFASGTAARYAAGAGGSPAWADSAAWLANWAWVPGVAVPVTFLPLYFPYGRLPSRRWRTVPLAAGVGLAAFSFSQACAAGPLPDYEQIVNPYGIDHPGIMLAGAVGALLLLAAVAGAVASVVLRFRRAEGTEREQLKWLTYAGSFVLATYIPAMIVGARWPDVANAVTLLGLLALVVAIGIAILRHGLYDIDLLINRTLVYGGLTAGVVAVYVVLVGGVSQFFHERANVWLALLATGLSAVLVQPLRAELQRRVNRLLWHEDRRPGGLRERLREAFAPEAAELQRARERLVGAREEERRRLRRDLHDGLGPALAGAALKVEAAGNLLAADAAAAARLLDEAGGELQGAVSEVRRLVYGLRPPALDELGLVDAIREHGERLRDDARISVHVVAEGVNGLPAAVEVAAYRIAVEAMTNVGRHAQARTCTVRIAGGWVLELEVTDDGGGVSPSARAGVGTVSMRERAEELGGTLELAAAPGGGTTVRARLPLAER